jgi:hypothetical protein
MEKMLFTINGTGHLRKTAIEIFKIDDDSLDSSQITTLQAKSRLVFEATTEKTIEMIIKKVASSAVITGTVPVPIDKIVDQDFRDRTCHPKIS